MPLLQLRTSAPLPPQPEALLQELSSLVAPLLGKPERYVMTLLAPPGPICFGGDVSTPACYLELKSVGTLTPQQTAGLSSALCSLLSERLGVPADRIYLEFSGVSGHLWGWNGGTFG